MKEEPTISDKLKQAELLIESEKSKSSRQRAILIKWKKIVGYTVLTFLGVGSVWVWLSLKRNSPELIWNVSIAIGSGVIVMIIANIINRKLGSIIPERILGFAGALLILFLVSFAHGLSRVN